MPAHDLSQLSDPGCGCMSSLEVLTRQRGLPLSRSCGCAELDLSRLFMQAGLQLMHKQTLWKWPM